MRIVFRIAMLGCLAVMLGGAAQCKRIPEDRGSTLAVRAGQSTVVLGSSCQRGLTLGYGVCQRERGGRLPALQMFFTNAGDYMVSDCQFGILQTGSAQPGELVEVDISKLQSWVDRNPFCILKVEAVERYPDPQDPNQMHEVPVVGGFFIESLEPGYLPVPSPDVVAWCYRVERTTKGRTAIKECE